MYDDALLSLHGFVIAALVGLAFGIVVKVFATYEFERWNRKPDETDNAGAEEGDRLNPHRGDR